MYSHGRCVCSCVAIELKGEVNWKRKNDWMSESKETKKNENCLSPVCWLHLNIMCIITMFELTLCFPFLFKWICAISHLVHIIDSIFRFVDNLAMCQYPTVIRYSFSCWWPFFPRTVCYVVSVFCYRHPMRRNYQSSAKDKRHKQHDLQHFEWANLKETHKI